MKSEKMVSMAEIIRQMIDEVIVKYEPGLEVTQTQADLKLETCNKTNNRRNLADYIYCCRIWNCRLVMFVPTGLPLAIALKALDYTIQSQWKTTIKNT